MSESERQANPNRIRKSPKPAAKQKPKTNALDGRPPAIGHEESTILLAQLVMALELAYEKPTNARLKRVDEWLNEATLFLYLSGVLSTNKKYRV